MRPARRWRLVEGLGAPGGEQFGIHAGESGLEGTVGVQSLQKNARDALAFAAASLKARARAAEFDNHETHFLSALQEIAASGRTAAEELLGRYHGDWGGDLDRVYAEYSY